MKATTRNDLFEINNKLPRIFELIDQLGDVATELLNHTEFFADKEVYFLEKIERRHWKLHAQVEQASKTTVKQILNLQV